MFGPYWTMLHFSSDEGKGHFEGIRSLWCKSETMLSLLSVVLNLVPVMRALCDPAAQTIYKQVVDSRGR